jgi:predicted regulator of Ras-like GTPase activity (Roadblock/LC7/MglB family)
MDAAEALTRLIEESAQIEAACLFDSDGTVEASTLPDEARTGLLAEAARALAEEGESRPRDPDAGPLAQLEAATHEGSVFVVREGDRTVAAVTRPEPTVGLVFYDLKSCLRTTADENPTPRHAEELPGDEHQ